MIGYLPSLTKRHNQAKRNVSTYVHISNGSESKMFMIYALTLPTTNTHVLRLHQRA